MEKSGQEHFEYQDHPSRVPYRILVHTRWQLTRIGYPDANGHLVVPSLMEHWHSAMEINYIFAGTCDYMINGLPCRVLDGGFVVIGSGALHSVTVDYGSLRSERIGFTLQIDRNFLLTLFPNLDRLDFVNAFGSRETAIREVLLEIFSMSQNPNDSYRSLAVLSKICELFHLLGLAGAIQEREEGGADSGKNRERIHSILAYVKDNYHEGLTLESTAKHFSLSRGYFARFFKGAVGIPFWEYLTRYRLCMAILRMKEKPGETMTEIAMQSGFSDTRRFILARKKFYGMTPLQYRKTVLDQGEQSFQR